MNTPPIIRPLQSLLRGRLNLTAARPARNAFRPSTAQFRPITLKTPRTRFRREIPSDEPNPAATSNPTPAEAATETSRTDVTGKGAKEAGAIQAEATPIDPIVSRSKASDNYAINTETLQGDVRASSLATDIAAAKEFDEEGFDADAVLANASPTGSMLERALFETIGVEPSQAAPGTKAAKAEVNKSEGPKARVTKAEKAEESEDVALPRSLELLYMDAPRRKAKYGVPTCDLQLRSYSVRNLEFFCDFALRAAYYLGLPASGPVPLPRLRELWTVPRSHFIFKKSQENFSRITLRRLIQIKDGHPETVQVWLAFLQKHAYYGIGMKANMWEFSSLDVGKTMDKSAEEMTKILDQKFSEHMASHPTGLKGGEDVEEFLAKERLRASGGR